MSYSRPYIALVLEEEFKNPIQAKEIRNRTLEILKRNPGSASRIFDEMPSLLPKKTMQYFSKKCLRILYQMDVSSVTFEADGIHVDNEKDQEKIYLLMKEIIMLGIRELLDDKGHIKMELITLLGWESIQDQLGQSELTLSILCGYVGAINQEMVTYFTPTEISKLNPAYTGFFGYINEKVKHSSFIQTNIRQWIIEELNKAGYDFNIDGRTGLLNWISEHPKTSTLIVLAAITSASSLFFANSNAGKMASSSIINNSKRPGLP